MSRYDFIVIGGGPTGLYTAWQLAREGFRGIVVEEHPIIGVPRYCCGVVGKETFQRFSLPRESIQREIDSATIYSPSGRALRIVRRDTGAYIIDRSLFDQGLYRRAQEDGVEVSLSTRCRDVRLLDHTAEVEVESFGRRLVLKGRVVVIATGANYSLHRRLGFLPPSRFLDTSQVDVEGDGFNGVEVYLGRGLAPNSFAWIVPVTEGTARVGVSTYKDSNRYLHYFISSPALKPRIRRIKGKVKRKPIPIRPVEKSYGSRILLLGDAAGQVKTTTGGGVFYGLLCADAAVRVLSEALSKGEPDEGALKMYEKVWRARIGQELRIGHLFRSLYAHLEDEEIDRLIEYLTTQKGYTILTSRGSFDWHGRVLIELLRLPLLWKGACRAIMASLKRTGTG